MVSDKIIYCKPADKTKYRMVSDGIIWHLQYQQELSILNTFKLYTWKNIWRPYTDSTGGRWADACGYQSFVCSYNCVLNEFIKKWQNIQDYFQWAASEQQKLETVTRDLSPLKKSENACSIFQNASFN